MGFAVVVLVAELAVEEALAVEGLAEVVLAVTGFDAHFVEPMWAVRELAVGLAAHFELGLEAEVLEVAEGAVVQKD